MIEGGYEGRGEAFLAVEIRREFNPALGPRREPRTVGASLCSEHYLEKGFGSLGANGDTYLMLWSEVPESVRQACNQIRAAQSKPPLL